MTGFRNSFAKAAALLAVALFVSPAAAQDAPVVLAPSSDWHLDYADDSCRLARQFGEEGDENSVLFYIERYEPGDAFFMLVAGKPLETRREDAKTSFQFGPGGHKQDEGWRLGEIGSFEPALMLTSRLLPSQDADSDKEREAGFDLEKIASDTDIFGQDSSVADEARISWLEIRRRGIPPVRLELGSMDRPLAALRECTDELLTHWGIDLAAHRQLTRAAAPSNDPGTWLTTKDYPSELMRKGEQGLVQFRLSIAADGKPTACHIQRSTKPEGFDKAVCEALMRRARFNPALGADGQPIASYWRNSVRFQMP